MVGAPEGRIPRPAVALLFVPERIWRRVVVDEDRRGLPRVRLGEHDVLDERAAELRLVHAGLDLPERRGKMRKRIRLGVGIAVELFEGVTFGGHPGFDPYVGEAAQEREVCR